MVPLPRRLRALAVLAALLSCVSAVGTARADPPWSTPGWIPGLTDLSASALAPASSSDSTILLGGVEHPAPFSPVTFVAPIAPDGTPRPAAALARGLSLGAIAGYGHGRVLLVGKTEREGITPLLVARARLGGAPAPVHVLVRRSIEGKLFTAAAAANSAGDPSTIFIPRDAGARRRAIGSRVATGSVSMQSLTFVRPAPGRMVRGVETAPGVVNACQLIPLRVVAASSPGRVRDRATQPGCQAAARADRARR
jgi:hypothetical protein